MSRFRHLYILVCILSCLYLSGQQDLIGQWYRVDDQLLNPGVGITETQDSCIIEVTELDSTRFGLLIRVPKNSMEYGYSVGQIKWKNFKKNGDNGYVFEGLLMDKGPTGNFDTPVYIKAYMILLENKNTILLWSEDQSSRFGGQKQKWIRLNLY